MGVGDTGSLRQENLAGRQRVSEAGSATKSASLNAARLHTSLADMPSQALFTWVCALLGAMEKTEHEVQ